MERRKKQLNGLIARGIVVWVLIIVVETIHGIFRRAVIEPMVGDLPARQIGVFVGSVLICIVTVVFVRWLKASRWWELLVVGLLWVALTLAFEVGLGRFGLGMSWEAIAADYDISRGGLMIFGLIVMLLAPLAAGKLLDEA